MLKVEPVRIYINQCLGKKFIYESSAKLNRLRVPGLLSLDHPSFDLLHSPGHTGEQLHTRASHHHIIFNTNLNIIMNTVLY